MTFDEPTATTHTIPSATLADEFRRVMKPTAHPRHEDNVAFQILLEKISKQERRIESLVNQVVELNSKVYALENPFDDIRIGY